jgi:hypothetical protein
LIKFVNWITLNVIFVLMFLCRYHNVNINVAVQTDHGLFVPVVRVSEGLFLTLQSLTQLWLILTQLCIHNKYLQDADKKGLSTIGEEVKQLAKRAKENSLKPQDYEVTEVLCSFLIHLPMMKSCTSLWIAWLIYTAGRYIYSV